MTTAVEDQPTRERPPRRFGVTSLEILCVLLVLAVVFQGSVASILDVPKLRTASTVFVAVCVQALPFLVLGVVLSGAIAAFIPASALRKALPRKQILAVPVAGIAGVALPGCECASVPVSRRLIQQGVPASAALAFLLAAPAVNPIVLVATAVAFPGRPEMVLARFVGSLVTAIVMGWLWARFGKLEWMAERALRRLPEHVSGPRWKVFVEATRHDLVGSAGFLVIGGITAAAMNVYVKQEWLNAISGNIVLGVLLMALLAVILAICSEADAFVAASLSMLPLLPRLVFLVVGPVVDVKLIALQAGTFGRSFAFRFAPVTFVVATVCAVGTGLVVLGGVG
ncbi:permease [Actinocrispum wychmicini]|uniref:Permease n=1 Tax=Actinocrispum wychmicini TaxID=1213861 RepID=A0A4R2J0H3_9PSEU|nr:permease [Actinocrispum wychmicini]TCO50862.1 hypothetical protein EV192_113243 [Actinocrispum wychmicini]